MKQSIHVFMEIVTGKVLLNTTSIAIDYELGSLM